MKLALKGRSLALARREVAALKPGEMWAADHPISLEEFNFLTEDETRAELFEGVIFMAAPNDEHEALFAFLLTLLKNYVAMLALGEVRGSRSGVLLDDFSAPQPDVLFVSKHRVHIIQRSGIVEPPDAIMEIVSSDTGRYRAMARMLRFAQFGVPEFWYIDLPRKLARLYHLNPDGEYEVTFAGKRGVIRSKLIPGFAIQARWLWCESSKLPPEYEIAQELVAGRVPR
jgi:Uma2 family endonuclease